MKKLIWIPIYLLLAACSGGISGEHALSSGTDPKNISADSGFIIGVMSSDENSAQYHRGIIFRGKNNNIQDSINVKDTYGGFVPPGYEDELFAYALPAGQYEIVDLYTSTGGPASGAHTILNVNATWSGGDHISIPFTVTAGKATYIGDIKNMPTTSDTWIPLMNGGYFIISDQSQRDLPALKKKFPFLDMNNVIIGVPKSGNVPPQFVQFK